MDDNGTYFLTVTSNPFQNQILTLPFDVVVQNGPEDPAQLSQSDNLLSIGSLVLSGLLFVVLLVVLVVVFATYFRERIRKKKVDSPITASESVGISFHYLLLVTANKVKRNN